MSQEAIPSGNVPFRFDDPKQSQIHQNLELFGQGPAKMFRDACAIISGRFDLLAATHIVGHLLREVLGAVLDVLIPPEKEKEFRGDGANERKAKYALTTLKFAETDFVWQFWVEGLIKGQYQLHRFAHRERLFGPRRMDAEFVAFWNNFVDFFNELLERTRGHLLEICRPLEELARKPSPTKDDANQIAEKLPHHPVYLKRFLDKTESPDWVELLDERGYFDTPPSAVSVNGVLRAEPWPQDAFLLRMAPQTPEKVAEILRRLDWPWNPYLIFGTIIDAIKATGPAYGRPLVLKLITWIDTHGTWLVDHYVGELVEDLGKNEAADLAIEVTKRLVKFDRSTEEPKGLLGPAPIVEEHVFRDVVTTRIQPCLKARPLEVIGLLCDTLEDGLGIVASHFKSHEFAFEMSTYDLAGEAEQVSIFGVLASLAHAIRNHACAAASEQFTSVREICDLLDKYKSRIFKRLEVYVVALNSASAPSIVRSILLNEELFHAPWLATEFNLLSEKGYSILVKEERAKYFVLLAKVPPFLAKMSGPDQAEAFERWQLARMKKLGDALPHPWKEKLSTLNDKYASSLAAIEGLRKGRTLHHSSIDRDSLSKMEMAQLVEFAKSWKPESGSTSHDLDLGYALSHRISTAPQTFVEHADALKELDVNSIWWFFRGLSQALKENRSFDWAKAIPFAHEVYSSAAAHALAELQLEGEDDGVKMDSDWTRQAVVQLIDDGLHTDELPIPDALLHDTLSLLEIAALDPDPSETNDIARSRPGRAMDLSINCTRGIAFGALYHFVGRIKGDKSHHSDSWTKIKLIVDNYLKNEPSQRLAVHVVLGQLYPELAEWDSDWGLTIRDSIFPRTEDKRLFLGAAWEGYVSIWRPSRALFNDLLSAYSLVSNNLKTLFASGKDEASYPAARTIGHVIGEFGRNNESLSEDGPLLKKLIASSSPQLRKTAIEIAGNYWSGADSATPNGKRFAGRMQEFYTWRFDQCRKIGNRDVAIEEAWVVGDWPREGFADVDWWLDQLINILATWNATPRHSGFSDYLPECAASHPEKVLAIIEALVDAKHPEWAMISMHSDIKDALGSLLVLDREKYFERIRLLINRFSTKAVTGFDELLRDSDEDENPGIS